MISCSNEGEGVIQHIFFMIRRGGGFENRGLGKEGQTNQHNYYLEITNTNREQSYLRGLARYGHHVASALKKFKRHNQNMLTPPNQAQ